jgi:hypothetical protein
VNLLFQFPFCFTRFDHFFGLGWSKDAAGFLTAFASDLREIRFDFFLTHIFKKGMRGASAVCRLFSGNVRHLNNSLRNSVLSFGQSLKGRRPCASSIFSRTIKAVSVPCSRIDSRDATDETLYFTATPADKSEGGAGKLMRDYSRFPIGKHLIKRSSDSVSVTDRELHSGVGVSIHAVAALNHNQVAPQLNYYFVINLNAVVVFLFQECRRNRININCLFSANLKRCAVPEKPSDSVFDFYRSVCELVCFHVQRLS